MSQKKIPVSSPTKRLKYPGDIRRKAKFSEKKIQELFSKEATIASEIHEHIERGGRIIDVRDKLAELNALRGSYPKHLLCIIPDLATLPLTQGHVTVIPNVDHGKPDEIKDHLFEKSYFPTKKEPGPYLRVEVDILHPTGEILEDLKKTINRYKVSLGYQKIGRIRLPEDFREIVNMALKARTDRPAEILKAMGDPKPRKPYANSGDISDESWKKGNRFSKSRQKHISDVIKRAKEIGYEF